MQLFVVSDFVVRINNKIHNIDKGVHFLLHSKRKDIIGSGVSFNHFYLQSVLDIRLGYANLSKIRCLYSICNDLFIC